MFPPLLFSFHWHCFLISSTSLPLHSLPLLFCCNFSYPRSLFLILFPPPASLPYLLLVPYFISMSFSFYFQFFLISIFFITFPSLLSSVSILYIHLLLSLLLFLPCLHFLQLIPVLSHSLPSASSFKSLMTAVHLFSINYYLLYLIPLTPLLTLLSHFVFLSFPTSICCLPQRP